MRKFIIAILILNFIPLFLYPQQLQRDNLKKHIYTLSNDSLYGRRSGTIYAEKASEYIKHELNKIGITTNYQKLYNGANFRNVLAFIEGSDTALNKEIIVIGAHYDHLGYYIGKNRPYYETDSDNNTYMVSVQVKDGTNTSDTIIFPGADDNASGVAALIELARVFYENKSKLKRSVVFVAFDANEVGLIGANHFVEDSTQNYTQENIKMMICLNMIGRLNDTKLLEIIGVGMLKDYDREIKDLLKGNYDFDISVKDFDDKYLYDSDTYPFVRKAIPSLLITNGKHSSFRKIIDRADFIDYSKIDTALTIIEKIIWRFDTIEQIKPSGKTGLKIDPIKRNHFGVSLGLGKHRYSYKDGLITGKSSDALLIGGYYKYPIKEYFAIKGEFNYEYKEGNRLEGKVINHTLSTPVSWIFRKEFLENNLELSIGIGLFYDFNFWDKIIYTNEQIDKNVLSHHIVGTQYSIEVRYSKYVLTYQSKYSFNDPMPSSKDRTQSITSFVKFGYIF